MTLRATGRRHRRGDDAATRPRAATVSHVGGASAAATVRFASPCATVRAVPAAGALLAVGAAAGARACRGDDARARRGGYDAEPSEDEAAVEEWVVHVYAPEAEAPDYLVSAADTRAPSRTRAWAAAAPRAVGGGGVAVVGDRSSSAAAEGVAFRMAWRDHAGARLRLHSGRVLGVSPESSADDLWFLSRKFVGVTSRRLRAGGGRGGGSEAGGGSSGGGAAPASAPPRSGGATRRRAAAAEEFDLVSPWEIELAGAPAHEPPTVAAAAAIGAELAAFAAQPETSGAAPAAAAAREEGAEAQRQRHAHARYRRIHASLAASTAITLPSSPTRSPSLAMPPLVRTVALRVGARAATGGGGGG